MLNISLVGKRALVAGSTQGIGLAIAKEFAEAGASVTLVARNETSLVKVKSDLNTQSSQDHHHICADFNDKEKLSNAVKEYFSRNSVDILVNNTGGPAPGKAHEASVDEFTAAFSQHLLCNQILTSAAIAGMKTKKFGRIINIISISVKQPIDNLGVSNTVRGAVASWAKTLANELGQFGITVNNILPGYTETARLESLLNATAQREKVDVAEVRNRLYQGIPVRRFALPEETAGAALFLASEGASYITGINLPVDGGRLACL